MKTKLLILLSTIGPILGCQNGQYIGPSVAVNGGYNGITAGVTLYGQNPATPIVVHATSTPQSPPTGK